MQVPAGEHEWDAAYYNRASDPQVRIAEELLTLLPEPPPEHIVDAGCGSGRATARLLGRLPHASVTAVDLSAQMLDTARQALEPRHGGRIAFERADLQHYVRHEAADCIFSNAVLHWVPDHRQLFANLHDTLRPGGTLLVQFAYHGKRTQALTRQYHDIMQREPFRKYFAGWRWCLEDISVAREHAALARAGFVRVEMHPRSDMMSFASAKDHRSFLGKVVLRDHLARLPNDVLRDAFLDETVACHDPRLGSHDVCYESLRVVAQRPDAT